MFWFQKSKGACHNRSTAKPGLKHLPRIDRGLINGHIIRIEMLIKRGATVRAVTTTFLRWWCRHVAVVSMGGDYRSFETAHHLSFHIVLKKKKPRNF